MKPYLPVTLAVCSVSIVTAFAACSSTESTTPPTNTVRDASGDAAVAPSVPDAMSATADAAALPTQAEFCAADTARHTRCTDGGTRACNAASYTCVTGILRTEVASKMLDCLSNRACGISDDACLSTSFTPLASDETFAQLCGNKFEACRADGGSDTWGFLCGYAPSAMKPALGASYTECANKSACGELGRCLEGVFDSVGCEN